jgi:hypothetical protein
MKIKYKVTWGEGQAQANLSKTSALKIAGELLSKYDVVIILKYKVHPVYKATKSK